MQAVTTSARGTPPARPPGTTGAAVPGRRSLALTVAGVAATLVPIGVATARALHQDWLPVGDNALFAIRARDVFTGHIPLVGTWSSASLTTGTDLNHPGPLLFDWLALPVRIFPGGGGVAIGVALLNASAVVGLAIAAHRRGGALATGAATVVAAALCWSMGSELLFEPWNPHSVLLPFLCYLVLVWGLACGDVVLLPFAVVVGSLVLQTHLSYALLVPVLGVWGVVGLLLELRRRRAAGPVSSLVARRTVRAAALAGVVAVACWAQPVAEQMTADGDGNLTRLVSSAADAPESIGYRTATQLVADVSSLPPWWVRPSFRRAWTATPARNGLAAEGVELPPVGLAVASLVVLALVLAALSWDARIRGDRDSSLLVATAAMVLVAALLSAARAPTSGFGLAPHQFRWLWPAAAFVTFALVTAFLRGPVRRLSPLPVAAGLTAVTVLLAVLNLPFSDQGTGAQPHAIDVVRDLDRQLGPLEHEEGPLLVDDLFTTFADPYGTAILDELHRRGIAFVTANPALLRQLGPDRRFDGTNARAALLMRTGSNAANPPPDAREVARHEGLAVEERRELRELEDRVRADLAGRRRLPLTSEGEEAVREGRFPGLRAQLEAHRLDPDALLASGELVTAVARGFVALDGAEDERLVRYAGLRRRSDDETVALFVTPL